MNRKSQLCVTSVPVYIKVFWKRPTLFPDTINYKYRMLSLHDGCKRHVQRDIKSEIRWVEYWRVVLSGV